MPSSASVAVLHHPGAVDTSRPHLMGRHAAGEGFLRGLIRHGEDDVLYCHALHRSHFEDFSARVGPLDERRRERRWIPVGRPEGLAEPGCLFVPEPAIADFAWRRRCAGPARAWSVCGVTHTIASENAMDAIGAWLTGPVQPWDAVICTSRTAKATVSGVLGRYAEYLAERTGGTVRPLLQLPVIPLGVDSEAYADGAAARRFRKAYRERYGIGDGDVALLFVGRLSFHAKAHPLPMYLAAEEAVRRTGRRVHLIQAGWFANAAIERQFRDGAKAFCPSVNAVFADGRDPDIRRGIWFAADIFVSLSDNIQETFGLTPIEAMAAGLPVLASDWDGYRDTVRSGVDGFLVPTAMPTPGSGDDIRLLTGRADGTREHDRAYNLHCAAVSQSTAVDVADAGEALSRLVADGELRRRIGAAGRRRAHEVFDWRVVIAAYEALWAELAEIRRHDCESVPRKPDAPAHPLRDDPYRVFAAYPTAAVGKETRIALRAGADLTGLRRILANGMNRCAPDSIAGEGGIAALFEWLAEAGDVAAQEAVERLAGVPPATAWRTLGWLAKIGVLRLTPPATVPAADAALGALRKARIARAHGDVAGAGRILHAELASNPDHPRLNAEGGELLLSRRRPDLALSFLHRSVRADPTALTALLELGSAQTLSGDTKGGIATLRRCVKMAPDHPAANMRLGAALWRGGRAAEAEPYVRIGIASGFREPAGSHQLALILWALGRTDDARKALRTALAAEPGNPFVLASIETLEAPLPPGGPRIALYLAEAADYSFHKPLFDRLRGRAGLLFTSDTQEIALFVPEAVVSRRTAPALVRAAAPEALQIDLSPEGEAVDAAAADRIIERVLAAIAAKRQADGAR